jgi:hypothetical protein
LEFRFAASRRFRFVQRLWRDDALAVEEPVDPAGGALTSCQIMLSWEA